MGDVFILYAHSEYRSKKLPEPTKPATIILSSNHAMYYYVGYWYVIVAI